MIRDSGVSGNGSYFGARFKAGDVISASQLNDLNSGLMVGTVQPYLGAGATVAYGAGGTQVIVNQDLTPTTIYQHQVVMTDNKVQVARGTIVAQNYYDTREYTTQAFGVWPSGSLTAGSDSLSPFLNQGGYVALTSGTSYNVYLIRNQVGTSGYGNNFAFAPLVCIIPIGGDGYTKSTPWNEGTDKQNVVLTGNKLQTVNIIDPSSVDPIPGAMFTTSTASAEAFFTQYNCQRLTIASLIWDGTSAWTVTQYLLGPIAMEDNMNVAATYYYDPTLGTPPLPTWLTTPDFATQEAAFEGAWSDCDRYSGGLTPTVQVGP